MITKVIVTVQLNIEHEEGVSIDKVIQDMDYNFKSCTQSAEIAKTEILKDEIV